MATFGMSAEVVRQKAQLSPLWPKSLRYLLPTVRGLFTARESRVRLKLDGQILEREAFCIMVAKGAYSGGGMRFGSHVALDDGRFEVTLFRPMPVWKMLVKTPKLYSGQLDNEPTIEKLSGSRIELDADPPILAEVDGDVIGRSAVSMTVLPRRIPVCFPRSAPEQAHAPQFIRLRPQFFCGAADRIKPPAHAFPSTNSRSDRNLERDDTGNRPGIFLVFLRLKKRARQTTGNSPADRLALKASGDGFARPTKPAGAPIRAGPAQSHPVAFFLASVRIVRGYHSACLKFFSRYVMCQ